MPVRIRGGRGSSVGLSQGGGGDALLFEARIDNLGGSTMVAGTEVSGAHPVKRGDCAGTGSIILKTSSDGAITHQMENEAYWDGGANADDSLRNVGFKLLLPADLTAGSSVTIRGYSSATAPNRTAPASVATVVAAIIATDDYQGRITFSDGNDDDGTWVGSRDHALGGTLYDATTGYGSDPDRGYRVRSHGPVCTVIEWWAKLYLTGNTSSVHRQLRCRGFTRYWHASGRTQDSVSIGLPNLYGTQGTHGRTEWENKFPDSLQVYRGSTKLREWLEGDTLVAAIGMAKGPWLGDADCDWDWSDGTKRDLWWSWDMDYAFTTKVVPEFDLTASAPSMDAPDDYTPSHRNIWPKDYHQTGDGQSDCRIGPVSLATILAWKSPGTREHRIRERIGIFGLPPSYNIDENTGLAPLKGDPDNNYGPYGDSIPTIGRAILWGTPSPSCQIHSSNSSAYDREQVRRTPQGTFTDEEGECFVARYSEGIVESSHWTKILYGFIANDERAHDLAFEHNLQLMLNRGGYAGHEYTGAYPGWDENPATGGYSYLQMAQVRGDGWALIHQHFATMFSRKWEYDYTNLDQKTVYLKDRQQAEADFSANQVDAWVAASATNFPGNFGGLPMYASLDYDAAIGNDSLGQTWYAMHAIYMTSFQATARGAIILSDDIGAAEHLYAWNGKMERYVLAWANAIGTSCNHYWSSFEGFPAYWNGSFANTTTDIETIKDALAEAKNSGTYSCPAGLAENGPGSILDHVMMAAAVMDQAGAGSLYDNGAVHDNLAGIHSSAPTLKYKIKKAA